MALERIAYPDWTEYRNKSGIDPLGMQNSSINLYQRLLPGISNVTLRMRYYGLYAWLADAHAKASSRSTELKDWQQLVRRAEALYALAAVHGSDQAGVAGSRWARRKLDGSNSRISFFEDADPGGSGRPYLLQAWGAYGAAYGSQLFEIGVLAEADEHSVPVPSEEIGDALAAAFSNALGQVADLYYRVVRRGTVTRKELHELAPALPSKIGKTSSERRLYQTLLFAQGKMQSPEDLARRDTLLLLLHAVNHFQTTPQIDAVRWLLYASSSADGRRLSILDEPLRQQQIRWWVYQANDLLHFSYETLLKFVLDTLADHPMGLPLNALIRDCVAAISEVAPFWPKNWDEFCRRTKPAGNAATEKENGERYLSALDGMDGRPDVLCTAECAWAALKLLAIVDQRAVSDLDSINQELGLLDQQFFHSLITETAYLSTLKSQDFTASVTKIIESRVVNRHLWVAHRKFRYQGDYTFLIEADEGRVRLRATTGPVFTNPRLGPALSFLHDIHVIDDKGLTALGRKLVTVQ